MADQVLVQVTPSVQSMLTAVRRVLGPDVRVSLVYVEARHAVSIQLKTERGVVILHPGVNAYTDDSTIGCAVFDVREEW